MAVFSARNFRLSHGKRANSIYEFLGRRFADAENWRFMNYGLAFDDPADNPPLEPQDETERYCAQLYHAVASQIDLTGKHLLDVGSGRGGGARYMHRYLGPASTTGMDLASSAVEFCKRMDADVDGLAFTVGNAMEMPFDDASFDAVTNVESSHCYPDRGAFFAEVFRVLKPGGSFLFTDFTIPTETGGLGLDKTGLDMVAERDVTPGIVEALALDKDRREQEIRSHIPRGLRWLGNHWAGGPGSYIFRDFEEGRRQYIIYHLRKPD